MLADTADTVGRVIAISGVWEPHVTPVMRRLLWPGDVFVDVGAHIGYYTLLGARIVGADGHVYAFEPSPTRCAELRANLARNDVANATVRELAAGSVSSTSILYEAPRSNTAASSVMPRAATSFDGARKEILVAPVQAHIAPEHVDRIRVVKVDVEGAEVEALRGLGTILTGTNRLGLFVEISPSWSVENPAVFLDELCRTHGFVPWRLHNEYTVDEYFPARPRAPDRIESIPQERADLVLVRGFDLEVAR